MPVTHRSHDRRSRSASDESSDESGQRPRDGETVSSQSKDKATGQGAAPPRWPVTFIVAAASGLALWASFPPIDLPLLAFVAPVGWLYLIALPKLPGRRPYLALYLAGLVHWMAMLEWIRLPHWSAYFGWLVLGGYLAVYVPAFVGLSRAAIAALRLPLIVAAPVVWTGLELARGHLFTGYSISLLGHSQVAWKELIQIADLAGGYTVSFLVMLVAACLFSLWRGPGEQRRASAERSWRAKVPLAMPRAWPLVPLVLALAAALGYGRMRLAQEGPPPGDGRAARVALIQGSIDTVFGDATQERRTFRQYIERTLDAAADTPNLDLVIWPETTFSDGVPLLTYEEGFSLPPDVEGKVDAAEFQGRVKDFAGGYEDWVRWQALKINSAARQRVEGDDESPPRVELIVGVISQHFGVDREKRFNTAIHVDGQGRIAGRYDKMHPVMFGEYVPFGDAFPWLYRLTPMPGGLTAGERAAAFEARGLRFSPSICFESTVPHLIRRQVVELGQSGRSPDVLVCVTNDGWFWGSSLLDLHLACSVFRAVELRRPVLVAANTGISASIDAGGNVRLRGPRREEATLVDTVRPDGRTSGYQKWGDLPAGLCLAVAVAAGIFAYWKGRQANAETGTPPE